MSQTIADGPRRQVPLASVLFGVDAANFSPPKSKLTSRCGTSSRDEVRRKQACIVMLATKSGLTRAPFGTIMKKRLSATLSATGLS
jgi:hypothetical protein